MNFSAEATDKGGVDNVVVKATLHEALLLRTARQSKTDMALKVGPEAPAFSTCSLFYRQIFILRYKGVLKGAEADTTEIFDATYNLKLKQHYPGYTTKV